MALLFRAPLLQFDIRDEKQVKKHWSAILKALSLSSIVLYERIQNKQPEDLSLREKKTVFRYLTRGKYRPTPFGLWAGVGVANWTLSQVHYEKPDRLRISLIESEKIPERSQQYWLNPSLEPWGDGWKFWNYDKESQKWRYSKSDNSPLIKEIKHLSFSGKPISQESLFRAFPSLLRAEKEIIWQRLIEQQLLTSGDATELNPDTSSEDYFITNQPEVPIIYKKKLDTFFSEIGNLAVNQNNSYLTGLITRFEEEFDDRFVPLKMLWKIVPHLILENRDITHNSFKAEATLFSPRESRVLNLRSIYINRENKKEISHVQALFRILENQQILIDNLVFNRPFVYGGRFTHKAELFDYFQQCPEPQDNVIYADVTLMEGMKAMRISSHKSVTPVSLNCFSGSRGPNELDTTETYIGIHNGKFILMAPKLGKQVIPLFQHPLNPQFITHPLCRILWEVAHQDFIRPIHYSEAQFTSAEYLPQLEWGEIILQPRQWRIKWEDRFRKERDLRDHLSAKDVPSQIMVGYQDQEFALDLNYKEDFAILMEELRQNNLTHIQECLWKHDIGGASGKDSFYPQYLYGKLNTHSTTAFLPIDNVNYISEFECKEWMSVRLVLIPDFQESVIRDQLRVFFDKLEEIGIRTYYFLFYRIKNAEIRIRCRVVSRQAKDKVIALLYTIQGNMADIDHIKLVPYYPEHTKYSKQSISLSEEIFCQESKLILQENPRSIEDKIGTAVCIGRIYFKEEINTELWLKVLRNLSQGRSSHESVKESVEKIEKRVASGWAMYYQTLLKRHHWYHDKKRKEVFVTNHIHMLINRLFWEEAVSWEPEIFARLERELREKKYGKLTLG